MMNFNMFNDESPLYQFRWFILSFVAAASMMIYHDTTGRSMFNWGSGQQQWSSSGPGYHK